MIQILLHLVNTFCELLSGSVVDVRQKTVHKAVLKCAPLFDDSAGFVCAEQMGLPAVVCVRLTPQITFTDKLVYLDRYEVGFDLADFHNIACGGIFWVVRQKHQNIERGLWEIQFVTQRSAYSTVGSR